MRQTVTVRLALALLVVGLSADVHTAPAPVALLPATAAPGSLIAVRGSGLTSAVVVWDAGQPGERQIPTSLGGTLFTVPRNASAGPHQVALEDASGRSPLIVLTVAGAAASLEPRIDHVMPVDVSAMNGVVSVTSFYVQGANIDVGAVVEVDESEVATVTHQAMLANRYGVPDSLLGRLVRHYTALTAVTQPTPGGTTVEIRVRNLDGQRSAPVTYAIPAAMAALDRDGDSLADAWEAAGHDSTGDGASDVDPYRQDLLVELDVMQDIWHPLAPESIAAVRAMFANAPLMSPYGDNGINLLIELGAIPSSPVVVFDTPGVTVPAGSIAFSALKQAHFGRASMGDVYHYVLWAREIELSGHGVSDQTPGGTGDDVLIGLDEATAPFQTMRSQAEILAHELGHNLGLRHGGSTDDKFNPSHLSVMSYTWLLRTGVGRLKRRQRATCLPFYYAAPGQVEAQHQVPSQVPLVTDYSAGMARSIVEGPLDEQLGVCGHPADWDHDGIFDTLLESDPVDANDDNDTSDTLDDVAAWRALRLNGPSANGRIP